MPFMIWFIGGLCCSLVIILLIDCELYDKAPWPERVKYGTGPFSGFIAYFKLRKERK